MFWCKGYGLRRNDLRNRNQDGEYRKDFGFRCQLGFCWSKIGLEKGLGGGRLLNEKVVCHLFLTSSGLSFKF